MIDDSFKRAVANVVHHGDTDIFPFPIENFIIKDKEDEIIALLKKIDDDFDGFLAAFSPANYGALAPVGYTGFRWATQIDPLWNLYFLSLVIDLGSSIEKARLPTASEVVYSYRFNSDHNSSDLFDKSYGWRTFNERAMYLSERYSHVISCDISEFYPRLNHHRLDNAIRQLDAQGQSGKKIMKLLSNFSGTYSFGLPVGGPASRILSELTLNQIDRLLHQRKIPFCRFADDFYLFSDGESDAFTSLLYLSEILHRNQGLQLQKSKTRIMSAAEFQKTNPLSLDKEEAGGGPFAEARHSLLRLSLHYDPYSPTAGEDYQKLADEIGKFPILDLIRTELSKTRINISLARKIVGTLQYMHPAQLDDAARTLIESEILLYPIYFNVLSAVRSIFDKLSVPAQEYILECVGNLIETNSPVVAVDLNKQYALRVLACKRTEEGVSLLSRSYDATESSAIRRDIILTMARWGEWFWLTDRRGSFRTMQASERRAFIIASYVLKDEGSHWRAHVKTEFSPFEELVRDWMSDRVSQPGWRIPL